MSYIVLVVMMAYIIHTTKANFDCIGTCYSGRLLPKPEDILHGQHLKGFSYKNITTDDPRKCYSSCAQDCRCKACQMKNARCELLDEDKTSKADSYVAESGYLYYDLKQTMYHGKSHMLPPGVNCHNGCCRSLPCLNGGTCTEHCQSPKEKFTCKCSSGYQGNVCEIKKDPTSCMDIRSFSGGKVPESKVYTIKPFANEPGFNVFCDFTDSNRTWTLVESFSLANNNMFKDKAFSKDFPHEATNPPNWSGYRLGKKEMMYIHSNSTLFRATCGFPSRPSSLTPDLVRGRLANINLFSMASIYHCRTFDYINIGGRECHSCSSPVYINPIEHVHMDTSHTTCSFVHHSEVRGADYFGFYLKHSSSFKCTATSEATTQWWFGI